MSAGFVIVACSVSVSRSSRERISPFEAILDRLGEREIPAGEGAGGHRPPLACDWTSLLDLDAPAPATAPEALYADAEWSDSATEMPLQTVREAVARELRLSDGLAPAELHRIRRAFAFRNHPDRVSTPLKRRALQRMTEANALIDAAIATARARIMRG